MDLDVVDLSSPQHQQVATMRRACEELGFFRIPLHSVDQDVADRAWEEARLFFARPIEDKLAVGFPQPGYPYGYSPFQYETLAKSTGDGAGQADLKESFSVGPDCLDTVARPAPDPVADDWIRSPSLWPASQPTLRPAWEAYFQDLSGVAAELLAIMALALELPADYFVPLIDRPITSMRAINYPELPAERSTQAQAGALRAGAHSDYGTLTILRTDDVAGLEIQRPDGSWAGVSHDPDTLVVNLGDSIAQWTNDRWPSTVHRVALTSTAQRQSFAFFHMANWDATIECLPTCLADGVDPRHAPAQAGPWLMKKFQATVT